MTADKVLFDLATLCGVFAEFTDLEGVIHATSPDTQRALLRANGLAVGTTAEVRDTLEALRAERSARLVPQDAVIPCDAPAQIRCAGSVRWQVVLEGETTVFAEGQAADQIDLPPLPAGLHDLQVTKGTQHQCSTLIAAPARTPSLQDVSGRGKSWGVVTALYGLTSERNTGLGDFEDLAQLAEGLGPQGVGFLGINPVHALGWADTVTISPYSPTHRGFLNASHIALDRLPRAAAIAGAQKEGDLIDYAAHRAHHQTALRAAFAQFQQAAPDAARRALAAFILDGGATLQDFALFESLSEHHGPDWRRWPQPLQTPAGARSADKPAEVAFHIWVQWLADDQLREAQARAQGSSMALGLYLDLAVGARLDGAEAWGAAQTLATGVSLGAPPDHLSPAGQNWNLAAYAPRRLSDHKYGPLRHVLGQAMRHCGILRIDHALGLNRSYWIPEDGSPGGYIRQPFQALMALIAIEAHRAGTLIVGEDLGLVPDGFRDTMAAKGFYGYTVLQYEKTEDGRFRTPQDLRAQSLACFGTHDTPTLRGFWEGHDIDWWHRLGWIDAADRSKAEDMRAGEKADLLGVPEAAVIVLDATDLRDRVHGDLAAAPTALVAVQLDDLLGVSAAQNLPGTVDEHPNWRRKTPLPVQQLPDHDEMKKTARDMAKVGRSLPKTES